MPAEPLVVILTGPSGAGKDSVLALLKDHGLAFATTTTTRAPRESEREGVDYYFVSRQKFASMLEEGELLEHALVYGQEKGVTRAAVLQLLDEGRDVLLRVDVQGARYLKSVIPGAVTIFITVPTAEELRRRLSERATESPDELALRLETAEAELAARDEFDHCVVNDNLERVVAEIEAIIDRERAREGRKPVNI